MSTYLPDVELFEVDADPPPEDDQQHQGDLRELIIPDSSKRNEIPTELPPDNQDFIKDLPGRVDEE